jgi:hypothetical protein
MVSSNRSHIHRLEHELAEIAKFADQLPGVPREPLKAVHDLDRQRNNTVLSLDELGCWGALEQKTRLKNVHATSSSASAGFLNGRSSPRVTAVGANQSRRFGA